MRTPGSAGKHPSATLDLTRMGNHSDVPHTPVSRAPHTWPRRMVIASTPYSAAFSMIYHSHT